MKNAVWCVLALCLLGGPLSACSSHDASSQDPSSATDKAWSRSRAVTEYRSAMRPVTRELNALAAMSPSARLEVTRSALRAFSRASAEAADSVRRGAWDHDVRRHAEALAAALRDQADFLDGLAAKPGLAAIRAESEKSAQTLVNTRSSAAAVEKDLGINDGPLDPASPGAS